jgi:hypothetical protein
MITAPRLWYRVLALWFFLVIVLARLLWTWVPVFA